MKYRHAFHAGNFADVHKHVALVALLAALARKEKGFLHLDTHAGRGGYAHLPAEAAHGVGALAGALARPDAARAPELTAWHDALLAYRRESGQGGGYPGSPWFALRQLRSQDRAVFVEREPAEARALEGLVAHAAGAARTRVLEADGYAQLRALLPPTERRGLVFIDPPYETDTEATQVRAALQEAQRRFATGVLAIWYPIKTAAEAAALVRSWHGALTVPALVLELWIYPADSRVALNGSGLLVANPPFGLEVRSSAWHAQLARLLDPGQRGGWSVRPLPAPAR